jgi:formylglycine-generating enzyme required for sulfatase activity
MVMGTTITAQQELALGGSDPKGPSSGVNRVYRGGGWSTIGKDLRSSARTNSLPERRNEGMGFRIVRPFIIM